MIPNQNKDPKTFQPEESLSLMELHYISVGQWLLTGAFTHHRQLHPAKPCPTRVTRHGIWVSGTHCWQLSLWEHLLSQKLLSASIILGRGLENPVNASNILRLPHFIFPNSHEPPTFFLWPGQCYKFCEHKRKFEMRLMQLRRQMFHYFQFYFKLKLSNYLCWCTMQCIFWSTALFMSLSVTQRH